MPDTIPFQPLGEDGQPGSSGATRPDSLRTAEGRAEPNAGTPLRDEALMAKVQSIAVDELSRYQFGRKTVRNSLEDRHGMIRRQ